MTFNTKKKEFTRERIDIIEIDLDYCQLTQGVAPCTATETGNAKCFNTLASCNDLANYDNNATTASVKTFRFCTNRSPQPLGLDAIPSIESVSSSPAIIDVNGGLGVRSSLSVSFADHPSSDIDIDKYLADRTYIAFERGSFWTKLRARHPNYQFRELRHLSGYLENGAYDAANFETRYYVIDSLNVSNGKASITAKDPLKLASAGKAVAPKQSKGELLSAITTSSTTATLTPTGIGNAEYSASGKILIGSEIVSFTRSGDVLTIVRGANNTQIKAHSAGDTCQQCLEYNGATMGRVDEIVKDLLINYSDIKSSFINASAWAAEVDSNLTYLLDGIIPKPTDVNKLLKELSQAAPHYLWWDETAKQIQFTALKAPPASATVYNMDDHLIEVNTKDEPKKRKSSIFVNYGLFDPTKKLDDLSNYSGGYARIDGDSVKAYKSNQIEVINSRWINGANKAGAIKLATLLGRRFANIPKRVDFTLDPKDGGGNDVWTGQSISLNNRDTTDFTGLPKDTIYQIISAQSGDVYKFTGLEFNYGQALPDDIVDTTQRVYLVADDQDINLYDEFYSVYGTPTSSTVAEFILDGGNKVGASTTSGYAVTTGDWSAIAAGYQVTIRIDSGCFLVGKGGQGGHGSGLPAATAGGDALNLTIDCTIINNGVIGGGGGGGGHATDGSTGDVDGGGGAGFGVGLKGGGFAYFGSDPSVTTRQGANGTTDAGGLNGYIHDSSADLVAGKGGDLGQAGQIGDLLGSSNPGGAAGIAINENGNAITYSPAGDIRGAIV